MASDRPPEGPPPAWPDPEHPGPPPAPPSAWPPDPEGHGSPPAPPPAWLADPADGAAPVAPPSSWPAGVGPQGPPSAWPAPTAPPAPPTAPPAPPEAGWDPWTPSPGGPLPAGGGPLRLHPAAPLAELAGSAVILLLISRGRPAGLAFAVLLLLVVGAFRYLAWSRFTYAIEGDSLVTEGGILNRTRREVPLDRIQQVDLQRKLRHQVLGLAVVRVDTAGSGSEPEVTLDAVSVAEAERLRATLTHRDVPAGDPAPAAPGLHPAAPGTPPVPGPAGPPAGAAHEPEREVLAIDHRSLALAGMTGSKLAVVFAVAAAAVGLLDDLPRTLRDRATDPLTDSTGTALLVVGVLALLALPLALVFAAVAGVLADGGYRLTSRGDMLHLQRGLLDQRQANLAVHRVQVVRIQQSWLRRALGFVSVTLQSAGGSRQVEDQDARIRVPILREEDLDALLAEVLPAAPGLPALHPAPPAARRRAWVRRLVPAAVLAAAAALLLPSWGLLALVLVPIAAATGELAYRGLGWATIDDHVVARRGALQRETALVPVAKVQSTRLVSSPLQRRAGLASLHVDVAGRGRTPLLHDAAADDMARLHRTTAEAGAARRDERAVRRRVAAAALGGRA